MYRQSHFRLPGTMSLVLIACFGLTLVMLGPSFNTTVSAQTTSVSDNATSTPFDRTAKRIFGIQAAYQQHALNPAVDQQIWLAAAGSFYKIAAAQNQSKSNKSVNGHQLLKEASRLTTVDDARRWLSEHWQQAELDRVVAGIPESGQPIEDRISAAILHQLSPQSVYVSAKENRVNKQVADNQYVGIGIQVSFKNNLVMIAEPFKGGAAHKAGAKRNDYIMSVDGESMEGLDLRQVIDKLRGVRGSKVSVEVKNSDGSEPRLLNMTRDVIPIPSVKGLSQANNGEWSFTKPESTKATETQSGDASPIGYMKIDNVVGSTSAELRQAARQLADANAKGAILDLRNLRDCPLHRMTMICDVLMGKQTLGHLMKNDGQPRKLTTTEESDFDNMPLVVLLPGGRVGGPVLAALTALKQRPRTTLVGMETQSSGICRTRIDLPDGEGAILDLPYATLSPNSANPKNVRTNILGDSVEHQDSIFKVTADVTQSTEQISLEKLGQFFK